MTGGSGRRALVFVAAAGLVAGLVPALYYVWGNTQIVTIGYRIESCRQELKRLEQERRALELQKESLSSLERVEKKAPKLGLAPASPDRIVIVEALTPPVRE